MLLWLISQKLNLSPTKQPLMYPCVGTVSFCFSLDACALHSNQKRHSEMSIEPEENFSPKKAEENLTYLFLSIRHVDTILCSIVNKTKEKIQNNQRCVN
jgi:hypothetical protein